MLVTMEGCCCSHRGKEAIGHESHDVDHCVFDIVIVSSRRVVDVAVVKNLFNCSNLPGSCRGVFWSPVVKECRVFENECNERLLCVKE